MREPPSQVGTTPNQVYGRRLPFPPVGSSYHPSGEWDRVQPRDKYNRYTMPNSQTMSLHSLQKPNLRDFPIPSVSDQWAIAKVYREHNCEKEEMLKQKEAYLKMASTVNKSMKEIKQQKQQKFPRLSTKCDDKCSLGASVNHSLIPNPHLKPCAQRFSEPDPALFYHLPCKENNLDAHPPKQAPPALPPVSSQRSEHLTPGQLYHWETFNAATNRSRHRVRFCEPPYMYTDTRNNNNDNNNTNNNNCINKDNKNNNIRNTKNNNNNNNNNNNTNENIDTNYSDCSSSTGVVEDVDQFNNNNNNNTSNSCGTTTEQEQYGLHHLSKLPETGYTRIKCDTGIGKRHYHCNPRVAAKAGR